MVECLFKKGPGSEAVTRPAPWPDKPELENSARAPVTGRSGPHLRRWSQGRKEIIFLILASRIKDLSWAPSLKKSCPVHIMPALLIPSSSSIPRFM
ncbi:hypothetical protein CEXT_100041 [Caerostris extrusa]|uniref:Uncharacterized protein n=1 Tax=Caerostris extrusa TaxID=172846 RepID=A0AAV4YFF3_CAEEX|nr:hypothetical protein CEXT_100041 [Caerostris extrusa]